MVDGIQVTGHAEGLGRLRSACWGDGFRVLRPGEAWLGIVNLEADSQTDRNCRLANSMRSSSPVS